MKFYILTLFPDFFQSCLHTGLLGKAIKKSLIEVQLIDVKTFSKKGRADDYPFGGAQSMLLSYQPLQLAMQSIQNPGRVIYLSPQGKKLTATKAKKISQEDQSLTVLCGRYGGVDARFVQDYVDEEISIGDYVLNGGETASLVLIESCSRFLKGFMGNKQSYQQDSFEDSLLAPPQWTKPRDIQGHQVPEVIFSGHHKKIKEFTRACSLIISQLKRPDLLENKPELLQQIPQAKQCLKQLNEQELKALGLIYQQGQFYLLQK